MSQVDDIRAAADIVKIVGDYVQLRKGGISLKGLCPFHQEKTPSFSVHPSKQIFHCFGCGAGGDVFKFVMLIENLTFPEALRRVSEKVGIVLEESAAQSTYDSGARERAEILKIHEQAAKIFAVQMSATAEGRAARAYLSDRGLSEETVARFRLGYAPAEGTFLTRKLTEEGFGSDLLEKSGLVSRSAEAGRHYDRFRRRVIFPIANDAGKIIAFGGRILGDDQPKYLNSPETSIYTKSRVLYNLDRASQPIRKLDGAILVEGYMDCISVAAAGFENVVASCGTSLTESQVRLLGRYARRVVVNYDPDSAGIAATQRSLTLLLEEGFHVRVLTLPDSLDPDSFIKAFGAAAYGQRLTAAPDYFEFLTERAAASCDLKAPEGKVAAANIVLPHLASVPSPMLRAELAGRLAERLRVDERLLRDELRRVAAAGKREVRVPQASPIAKLLPAERELLQAFMENQALLAEFLPALVEEGCCEGLATEPILNRLLTCHNAGESIDLDQVAEAVSDDERRLLYESQFSSGGSITREQVMAASRALKRRKTERDREHLMAEIQVAIREGDSGKQNALYAAKLQLEKELRGRLRT